MGFKEDLNRRILVLDGAMGTMIQRRHIGDNEELNLSDPDFIREIHRSFIEAGADIIETNSFGANRISQAEYGLSPKASGMALEAARIARAAADASDRKVYVAGSLGPTGFSLTMPSDASDPVFRKYSFDELVEIYQEQMTALRDGGVDLFLLETCFDALVTKAAICALERMGNSLPVIISATVSDRSGRTLTGQTLEAFYHSVRHCPDLAAFGINCALGASQMKVLATDVAAFSDVPTIFYPNAGIPDEMGRYNDTPERMASVLGAMAAEGLVNIAGGCCGSTPDHISAVAGAVRACAPRAIKSHDRSLSVSGLEPVTVDRSQNFTNIGERTNVAGSRKFARLIASGAYEEALQVAADQIEGGARVIDINMDDAMLDSKEQMRVFLRHIASDPSVGKAAVMIDSSHFDTIEEALKNVQGRSIVNSISLKDGEEEFLRRARIIDGLGAAMVVMAFDEQGQAVTYDRKVEICRRSYQLLTGAGISPENIIFDVNVLSIGTGIPEHAKFAVDYIEAVRWIKGNLPGALTSGGISNLSFAFRGKNAVREAMHSVFLYHAIAAGLDMAIVNPQMLQLYDEIDPALRNLVEDLIFDRSSGATDALVEYASGLADAREAVPDGPSTEGGTAGQRLFKAVLKGGSPSLEADAIEAMNDAGDAVTLIEGTLMDAMAEVGSRFAEGKMFLPQVVRSAKVMQDVVSVLQPYMTVASEEGESRPKVIMATVKGDVHDIGKNITSIVLQCSGFEVIDLGVMVPAEAILEKAVETGADIIGVSGLITPSLYRMEELCRKMAEGGFKQPLFVGGAAASAIHTALKLAPLYDNVHYGADASATAVMAKRYMMSPSAFIQEESASREKLLSLMSHGDVHGGRGLDCRVSTDADAYMDVIPDDIGPEVLPASGYADGFDWKTFNAVCRLPAGSDEFKAEAMGYLDDSSLRVRRCVRFFECRRDGDAIVCDNPSFRLPMLRQSGEGGISLCDFFPEEGTASLGVFAISVDGLGDIAGDLVKHGVCVTLAETASGMLCEDLSGTLPPGLKLIMPGVGYACCPDHSIKRDLLALLPDMGITLTESCSMIPEASICGLVIAHRDACYADVRTVDAAALEAYVHERRFTPDETAMFLGHMEVVR